MTRSDYDDKPISAFFTLIGVLGTLPALYGLTTSGWITYAILEALVGGSTLDLESLPVPVLFISVTLSGFWLLWQYIRRVRGKPASVPQRTLWQLTAVQNALYLCASVAIIIVDMTSQGALYGGIGVIWFATLTALAANAASRSPRPDQG